MKEATLAVRNVTLNPDHHLWNNNGTWWCHFTVHLPDFTKQRVRLSLETRVLEEARTLRNALFRLFGVADSTTVESTERPSPAPPAVEPKRSRIRWRSAADFRVIMGCADEEQDGFHIKVEADRTETKYFESTLN